MDEPEDKMSNFALHERLSKLEVILFCSGGALGFFIRHIFRLWGVL